MPAANPGEKPRPRNTLRGNAKGQHHAAQHEASGNAVDELGQLCLADGADLGSLNLAVLEQQQGRDAANLETRGGLLVVVDIDLDHLDPSRIFIGQLVHQRSDHLARATPFGPEIDQNGHIALQHFGLEIGLVDMKHLVAH